VVPERCERFRESVSLGLDGMLSRFERTLLERHLRSCAGCRAFADELTAYTTRLRLAPLEPAPSFAAELPARRRSARRRAAGFAGSVAVAVVAALVSFAPAGDQRNATAPGAASNASLLQVVPEHPTANASFDVPRLRLVSASYADGPVRGYYGVPA
jgi:predicted anti-sigma-YlaC factor YlaD